jgi:histidine triad (HIT) family protein
LNEASREDDKRSARDSRSAEDCRFCAIARGDSPGDVVLSEPRLVAFLDHRPLFPGHTLLVPREHHETLGDLPAALVGELFLAAQLLSLAVERAFDAEGSFVAINNRVSQSVPHLHVHVVPRRRGDGLRGFFWPRQKYRDEAHIAETRATLASAVDALRAERSG